MLCVVLIKKLFTLLQSIEPGWITSRQIEAAF